MDDFEASERAIAAKFKALGDPTRLRIFEFLRGCCRPVALDETGGVSPVNGPTVGEVCCRITGADRATSTISFHLKELRQSLQRCRGCANPRDCFTSTYLHKSEYFRLRSTE